MLLACLMYRLKQSCKNQPIDNFQRGDAEFGVTLFYGTTHWKFFAEFAYYLQLING